MKLFGMIARNLARRPLRTLLTVGGSACALFLLVSVESLSQGLDEALDSGDASRTLIVYRQNRYCPQTSNLPERYTQAIAEVPGVQSVLPVKVFLNNCRASLDMIAFHGAPAEDLLRQRGVRVVEGDAAAFAQRRDGALVGRAFADRKGIDVGDAFEFGDVTVQVVGIFEAESSVEDNLILTHLEFLQRAGPIDRLGTVTQFEVKIADGSQSRRIAEAIDATFAASDEPTDTRPQIAFLEAATRDLREILSFARIFGLVSVIVVLILVGNTIFMSVGERVREFGLFMTLGFHARHILGMVLGEALLIGGVGALLGVGGAIAAIAISHATIGIEGVQIGFSTSGSVIARGAIIAIVSASAAGAIPAWRAAHRPVVVALREA